MAFADHDAVLVPLTAFDGRCHRLGQGGGFYDRALASLPSGAGAPRPCGHRRGLLVPAGRPTFPQDRWDVPLDAVATDAGIVIANGGLLA